MHEGDVFIIFNVNSEDGNSPANGDNDVNEDGFRGSITVFAYLLYSDKLYLSKKLLNI